MPRRFRNMYGGAAGGRSSTSSALGCVVVRCCYVLWVGRNRAM